MSALDTVRQAVEAKTGPPRGGNYRCPAHDDRNPSLSINPGDTGVVLHCHRECTNEDIMAAVGLPMSALYDSWGTTNTTKRQNGLGPIIDRYVYHNASGEPVFSVTRHDPKTFRQWRPDGRGGWAMGAKDVDKPLYHLPEVLNAIEEGEPVYVVEGEKDVEALRRAGLVATTNPMGAQGGEPGKKWKPSYTETLATAAKVVIIADDDEAGHTHARYVASQLREAGCANVEVYRPHEGHKDIAEHLGAGRSLDLLRPLEDGDVDPETLERRAAKEAFHARFITGGQALALPPPSPLIGTWVDRGAITIVPGPFGAGKTHLLMDMALSVASEEPWMGQTIHHTGEVWYFVGEGAYTISDRLRAWMARTERTEIPENVKWYPTTFDLDRSESWYEMRCALDFLGDNPPVMIVFDTWSKYISGAEVPDITKPALAAVEQIRDATGATIVIATHTGHNVTGRSRGDSTLEDNADIVIPVMGRLREQNGQIQKIQMVNTKQKARATQLPMWIELHEIDDPKAPDYDPEKKLAWVQPTTEPDDDEASYGPQVREDILARVRAHPGRLTKTDLHQGTFSVNHHRNRVVPAVDHMLNTGELVAQSWKHPDTTQKANRLYVPSDVDWR